MYYDMCVMKWVITRIDERNKLMMKAEDALRAMRSETKYYLIPRTFYDCSI